MKKAIIFLALGLMLAASTTDAPKTLKVEGELPAWQALLDCVEKSTAPHTEVKAVQEWVVGQLQKQLADSTKENKDSTQAKKPK